MWRWFSTKKKEDEAEHAHPACTLYTNIQSRWKQLLNLVDWAENTFSMYRYYYIYPGAVFEATKIKQIKSNKTSVNLKPRSHHDGAGRIHTSQRIDAFKATFLWHELMNGAAWTPWYRRVRSCRFCSVTRCSSLNIWTLPRHDIKANQCPANRSLQSGGESDCCRLRLPELYI